MTDPGSVSSTGSAATPLARLTTLRVGGPAERLLTATTEPELLDLARQAWADEDDDPERWFVLGGGSNVVVADEGFEGTVIRVATRGIATLPAKSGTVRLRVQAGESWDGLVRYAVENGLSGMEALSGIPGSVGAAPIQNIGAYGQEVESSIVSLDFLDADSGEVVRLRREELGLGYRTSVFKRGRRGVVLSVTFDLTDARDGDTVPLSRPIAYGQLATALGVEVGERMPLTEVRATVLGLRASKGMVLDAADPDSVSAGSFFTNPIVTEAFARTLPSDAPRWQIEPDEPDLVVPIGDAGTGVSIDGDHAARRLPAEYHVKLSAAWLIERAGVRKGFSLPGSTAAISSKHTLAIVNTAGGAAASGPSGGGLAADVAELARFVQGRVMAEFGVLLQPEPVFLGHGI